MQSGFLTIINDSYHFFTSVNFVSLHKVKKNLLQYKKRIKKELKRDPE